MPKIELKYSFENEEELTRFMEASAVRVAPAPAAITPDSEIDTTTGEVRTVADEITADADKDGMPYNVEFHATPKSMTADGLWRAKRGKADEANAARAAFKAAGGNVTPPVVLAQPAAPAAMPGMPPARAPDPITYEKLIDKTVGMMERGKIDGDGVMKLYGVVGIIDPAVLETNESLRAALFSKLSEIEPELA